MYLIVSPHIICVVENTKFEYFYSKLFIHCTMVKGTSLRNQRNKRNKRKPRRVKLLVQHGEIPKSTHADEEREFQLEYDLLDLCICFLDLTL
jgi:hypothetical protein